MTIASGKKSVATKSARKSVRVEGEVYRARDERLNRDVAIKVLPATYSQLKK